MTESLRGKAKKKKKKSIEKTDMWNVQRKKNPTNAFQNIKKTTLICYESTDEDYIMAYQPAAAPLVSTRPHNQRNNVHLFWR